MFSDSGVDAALYAGTAEQVANWPGTRAVFLMHEEVVPVASPSLLSARKRWRSQDLAALPLLQQSTRPDAWRQWFSAMGGDAALALHGPRYELFSMLAVAASCGLGVALVPRMLIESELVRGELRIACDRPFRSERNYYLVTAESGDERPAIVHFRQWLLEQVEAPRSSTV